MSLPDAYQLFSDPTLLVKSQRRYLLRNGWQVRIAKTLSRLVPEQCVRTFD